MQAVIKPMSCSKLEEKVISRIFLGGDRDGKGRALMARKWLTRQ